MKGKNNEYLKKLQEEKKRMETQLSYSIEIVGPDLARKFLLKNLSNKSIRNRKISGPAVKKYVKDMLDERWRISAPIIFDTKGNMIDGQTRCTAILKSNTPVLCLIVRGYDPETFSVLDDGKKRTHKDALTSIVSKDGKILHKAASVSAAINLMMSVERKHKAITKNRVGLTNAEITEIVQADFDFYNYPFESGKINKWRKSINNAISEKIIAGFYYIHKKKYKSGTEDFLNIITSNNSTTPGVVREFRDKIIENKGKKSDERNYLSPFAIYSLMETLHKYYRTNGRGALLKRKHFSKNDLIDITNG